MTVLRNRSQGQALPIIAMLLVVFIGLLGLAIDMGRLYIARTELSRAIDAAALAGVIELPDMDDAQTKASAYITDNQADVVPSFPAVSEQFQIRVKGTRTVDMLFMGIFGFGSINIDATATAGYGVVPVDTVLAIDATGSMGASPCNSSDSNPGCPIYEAKKAAKDFVDTLVGPSSSGSTLVGANAYRGCFNPPRSYSSCVPSSMLVNLSSNSTSLKNSINNIGALGGTGTNTCMGLLKADQILFGAGHHTDENTLRFIVILADGDNTWNNSAYGNGEPPTACRPNTSPWNDDQYVDTACRSAQTRERELDDKTYDMAQEIEDGGVEIYVVAFGVCGSANNNLCNTGMIGGTSHDNTADRNLLKCVASSASGTNDHYYAVDLATELPEVFQQIAGAIAFRLIE